MTSYEFGVNYLFNALKMQIFCLKSYLPKKNDVKSHSGPNRCFPSLHCIHKPLRLISGPVSIFGLYCEMFTCMS